MQIYFSMRVYISERVHYFGNYHDNILQFANCPFSQKHFIDNSIMMNGIELQKSLRGLQSLSFWIGAFWIKRKTKSLAGGWRPICVLKFNLQSLFQQIIYTFSNFITLFGVFFLKFTWNPKTTWLKLHIFSLFDWMWFTRVIKYFVDGLSHFNPSRL